MSSLGSRASRQPSRATGTSGSAPTTSQVIIHLQWCDERRTARRLQAYRATGSTSMIGLENSQWSINGQQAFSAASCWRIAGMTNVHWDDHYYNWLSVYSSSVADNLSALQAEVAGSEAYKDADGTIPVIIGDKVTRPREPASMEVAPPLSQRSWRAATGHGLGDKPRRLGRPADKRQLIDRIRSRSPRQNLAAGAASAAGTGPAS